MAGCQEIILMNLLAHITEGKVLCLCASHDSRNSTSFLGIIVLEELLYLSKELSFRFILKLLSKIYDCSQEIVG